MSQEPTASNLDVDEWAKEPARRSSTSGFFLAMFLAYSSTPQMETICFSETSVNFYQSVQRQMPENNTLHGDVSKNVSIVH
jgi:hypothetical protein